MGERYLLKRFAEILGKTAEGVLINVGDDAAVLESVGPHAVLSADMLIEGVDFERKWASAADIGAKSAGANLSDMAAMGAKPRGLLLSLAFNGDELVKDVLDLVRSLAKTGERFGAPLVGGDLSDTSGPMVVSVTVIGEVAKDKALRRKQAKEGDIIVVSGELGGARAALFGLLEDEPVSRALLKRQLRPEPRVDLGLALAKWGKVTACADISDGLINDCFHLPQPGLSVELECEKIPVQKAVVTLAKSLGESAQAIALQGGEDFELVFTVPESALGELSKIAVQTGIALTPVGRIIKSKKSCVFGAGCDDILNRSGSGFQHFS